MSKRMIFFLDSRHRYTHPLVAFKAFCDLLQFWRRLQLKMIVPNQVSYLYLNEW